MFSSIAISIMPNSKILGFFGENSHISLSQFWRVEIQASRQSVQPSLQTTNREFALLIGTFLRRFRLSRTVAVEDEGNIHQPPALPGLAVGRIGCEDEATEERSEWGEPQ